MKLLGLDRKANTAPSSMMCFMLKTRFSPLSKVRISVKFSSGVTERIFLLSSSSHWRSIQPFAYRSPLRYTYQPCSSWPSSHIGGAIGNSSCLFLASSQFYISSSWRSAAQPSNILSCLLEKWPSRTSISRIDTKTSSLPYFAWKWGGIWSFQLI